MRACEANAYRCALGIAGCIGIGVAIGSWGTQLSPRSCPHRLRNQQVAAVEQLWRGRQTEPAIARALGMARSAVSLILRRLSLNRLTLLEPKPPLIRSVRISVFEAV